MTNYNNYVRPNLIADVIETDNPKEFESSIAVKIQNYLRDQKDKYSQILDESIKETENPYSVDADSYSRFKEYQRQKNRAMNNLKSINYALLNTFHARLDFRSIEKDGPIRSVYIGKEEVKPSFNKPVVYNWMCFYHDIYKTDNIIVFDDDEDGNTSKEIVLRRDVFFEDGMVESVYDRYREGLVESNDVFDPYLLKVLEQKRRDPKITDIIRSIQKDQIKIMKVNPEKDILVQGCAGSGKTMILFHRIAYLMYNYEFLNTDNMRIIVPNHSFMSQMNDLISTLRISEIRMFTPYEFYFEIMKSLKIKSLFEIEIKPENSSGLSNHYKTIFSSEFCSMIKNTLVDNSVDLLEQEELVQLKALDDKFNKKALSNEKVGIESLKSFVRSFDLDFAKYYAQIDSENQLKKRESDINDELDDIYEELSLFIDDIQNQIQLSVKMISKQQKYIDTLQKISNLSQDDLHSTSILKELGANAYDAICEYTSSGNESIDTYLHIFERIMNYIEFSKDEGSDKYELPNLVPNKNLRNAIQFFSNQNINEDRKNHLLKEIIKNIEHDLQIWTTMPLANYKSYVSSLTYQLAGKVNTVSKTIKELEDQIRGHHTRFGDEIFEVASKEQIATFREIAKKLTKDFFDPIQLTKKILSKELGEQFNSGYRDHLFMLLQVMKYSNDKLNLYDNGIIMIDEVQELFSEEIAIFREIFNESAFNMFGDINQSTNDTFTDTTWLNLVYSAEYFELMQNYRSTEQITEFTNKELNMNIIPIGLSGPKVEIMNHSDFSIVIKYVADLIDIKRVVVILSQSSVMFDSLDNYGIINEVIKGDFKLNKLNVATIEKIKGLEFEIVIVVTDGMSDSEKYIAFSRALEELIIIE